jgi:hypothetical protein
VAAAADDEPQIVLAREVDGRDDIRGGLGRNGVDALLQCPRIDPASGLGQPHRVADEVWVLQFPEEIAARGFIGRILTHGQWRLHADQPSLSVAVQLLPACLCWPCGIGGTHPRHRLRSGRTRQC